MLRPGGSPPAGQPLQPLDPTDDPPLPALHAHDVGIPLREPRECVVQRSRVQGRRRDNGDEMTLEFTEADRARAGLNTKPWQQYPKAMFWARAVSQLCRELFPDVLSGLSYIAEEIGGEAHPADLAHSPTEIEPTGPRLETIRGELNDLSPERRSAVRIQMRNRELPESIDMMTTDELDEMEAIVGDAGAGAFDEPFPITDAELVDE